MERLRSSQTWAVAAPMLCAVHCAATPLFVLFIPALALTPAEEIWLLSLSSVVAALAVVPGLRVHGRWSVLVPIVLGIGVWAADLLHWLHPIPHPLPSAVGASLIAFGIFRSSRLSHRANCITCEVHAQAGRGRHIGSL